MRRATWLTPALLAIIVGTAPAGAVPAVAGAATAPPGAAAPAPLHPAAAPAGPAGTQPAHIPVGTGTVLPAPTGAWAVGTSSEHLVDHRRVDPWAPDARRRELMIQTWYPARPAPHRPSAAYQSLAAGQALEAVTGARPGSFTDVTTHARSSATPLPVHRGRPLLLFSHGRSGNRTNLTAVAEDLASHGYLVVAVDHTFDSLAVQFPGGRVVTANRPQIPDAATAAAEVAVRAADLRFVLDRVLAGRAARPVSGQVDARRIGVFGHSLGGASAAELLRTDRRVRAGLNLDGALFTTGATLAVDRPFLLFTRADQHESWTRWRAEQRRWGRHLTVAGAGHFSFTDLDLLVEAAGLRATLGEAGYAQWFGSIAPGRTTALDRRYVRAMFDLHLRHRPTKVFDRPADPEVRVEGRS